MLLPGQPLTKYLKTDRSFDPANTAGLTLAIQAGANAIRGAVFEGTENRCIALADFSNTTTAGSSGLTEQVRSFTGFREGVCDTVPWLCGPFAKRWLAWEGKSSTLVPSDLMIPGEKWEYLSFGHRIEAGETVLSDRLSTPDAFNVYSMPEKIRELIISKFGSVGFFHYTTPLIAGALADHGRHLGKPVLYAYLSEQVIDLVLVDRSGLKFHNCFPCTAPEDAIYYIIYVLQQFSVDPEHAKVLLTGQVSAGDRLFVLLGKYVGNPAIPLSVHEVHPSKDLEEAPLHAWFPLLNLFRCAL